jgi:predicted negative regulator of RcsB-dependent stress response
MLEQAAAAASGLDSAEARIRLARVEVRLGRFDTAQALLDRAGKDLATRTEGGLTPLLHLVRGELAYEAGREAEARGHFTRAATASADGLAHEAAVTAAAYGGVLGRDPQAIRASLARASEMGRYALEATARVFLAKLDVEAGRFRDALRVLDEIPPDTADRTIGREIRAEVHHWRARALAAIGDRDGAAAARAATITLLGGLRSSLPDGDKAAFDARVRMAELIR